jgi:hypothetical protein
MLNLKKSDTLTILQKFPVSAHLRSIKIQKEKATIEKRLDEIDFAIKCFEMSKVFLKL